MRSSVKAVVIGAACCVGCASPAGPPTFPDREIPAPGITRLAIFVRDWPDEYVEIALTRDALGSTLIIYRPPQPGMPRVLIDSIGPTREDPAEVAELLNTFDVWAMADSNAAGAACNTLSGFWRCSITFNDYSLVIGITAGGTKRAQRYTGLRGSESNTTARELGDFVFGMARKREG